MSPNAQVCLRRHLRYYEKIGLLKSLAGQGQRRQFAADVADRFALFALGQAAGFSLDEVGAMLVDLQVDRQKPKGRDVQEQLRQMLTGWRPERQKHLIFPGQKWRRPHQPHPGTRCSRYGCSLPGLTRLTGNQCGGTDGATTTRLAEQRVAPLYWSWEQIQPLGEKKSSFLNDLSFREELRPL